MEGATARVVEVRLQAAGGGVRAHERAATSSKAIPAPRRRQRAASTAAEDHRRRAAIATTARGRSQAAVVAAAFAAVADGEWQHGEVKVVGEPALRCAMTQPIAPVERFGPVRAHPGAPLVVAHGDSAPGERAEQYLGNTGGNGIGRRPCSVTNPIPPTMSTVCCGPSSPRRRRRAVAIVPTPTPRSTSSDAAPTANAG